MEKKLTAQQYADLRGVHNGAVRKAIKLGHNMPGVIRLERFGNAHVIVVSESFVRKQKNSLKKVG